MAIVEDRRSDARRQVPFAMRSPLHVPRERYYDRDFYGTPVGPRGPAPELGQHTEEVLLEAGYDWEAIADLRARGAW